MAAMLRISSQLAVLATLFAYPILAFEPPLYTEQDEALASPSLQTYIVEYDVSYDMAFMRIAVVSPRGEHTNVMGFNHRPPLA